MDEKGFMLQRAVKCIKESPVKGNGNGGMVIDIEKTSAAGPVLPPYTIYKGRSYLIGSHQGSKDVKIRRFVFLLENHYWYSVDLDYDERSHLQAGYASTGASLFSHSPFLYLQ